MSTSISTAQELAASVKRNESRIVITGKLGDAIITIEAVGPVAWGVATGAITVAVASVVLAGGSGGTAVPISAIMGTASFTAAASALGGIGAASTAISIALAGGGVGALHALRKYSASREGGCVVLTKRW